MEQNAQRLAGVRILLTRDHPDWWFEPKGRVPRARDHRGPTKGPATFHVAGPAVVL